MFRCTPPLTPLFRRALRAALRVLLLAGFVCPSARAQVVHGGLGVSLILAAAAPADPTVAQLSLSRDSATVQLHAAGPASRIVMVRVESGDVARSASVARPMRLAWPLAGGAARGDTVRLRLGYLVVPGT